MQETPEQFNERMADAEASFALRRERVKAHETQLTAFSIDAMKAPALVAAAGVAAALGFYSANYDRLAAIPVRLTTFNDILFWLFTSLLLTVAAPGLAYFSQISYVAAIHSEEWGYERPFTATTRKAKAYTFVGDVCRWSAVGLVVCALLALARGGQLFLQLVAPATI